MGRDFERDPPAGKPPKEATCFCGMSFQDGPLR